MKNASLSFAIVLGLSSSAVLAEPATQALAAPAKPARPAARDKAREAGLAAFRECLNNRPVEAEAYDCAHVLAAHPGSTVKLATHKPAPALLKVATAD